MSGFYNLHFYTSLQFKAIHSSTQTQYSSMSLRSYATQSKLTLV